MKGQPMTLFSEIKAAGIPFTNHESDLYVLDCQPARDILKKYPTKFTNATRFKNAVDGRIWIDIPFNYDPFWEKRQRTA
jgi:hypothetical protein